MSLSENPGKPIEKIDQKEKPKGGPKNRDVLKVNLGKAKSRSFSELRKSVDERAKTVKTVGGVFGNSEDFLAMADAKIEEKEDKLKIDLDFEKLNKGMDGKGVELTEIFTPDFKELNVGGKAYTRGMKDGKLAYYSEDGKEVPMDALKGKMSFDFSESQMLDLTRSEVEEMVQKELELNLKKTEIQNEGIAQRFASMDRQFGGGGGGGSGGGGVERMSPSAYASVAPSRAPRNYRKFEQGVAPEQNTFDVNQSAKDFLQDWERKYPGYMNNQETTAQRIQSRTAKMAYVRTFQDQDIPRAIRSGWSAEKQNRPLMITRDRMSYLFVPAVDGQRIDLNNPDTFHLLRMPISTGKGGYGNVPSSAQTPIGLLEATDYQETGPKAGNGVNVYRIILQGRESGNINSEGRAIRAHQGNLDRPSGGCLRFGARETIFLASQVKQFGSVFINVSPNGVDETPVQTAMAGEQTKKKV